MSDIFISGNEDATFILPDGSSRSVRKGTLLQVVAASLGTSVEKNAVYAEINGTAIDLDETVKHGGQLKFITIFDEEVINAVRRNCLLLLGLAVKQLYPRVRLAGCQVAENSFSYDFASDVPFTAVDLTLIEERMAQLVIENPPLQKTQLTQPQAKEYFLSIGEDFKSSLIESLPANSILRVCQFQGHADYIDGPVVPDTRFLRYFKLLGVSGCYWQGSSENIQLQRIQGTGWASKKQLDDWLETLAEAEKRDHRKLGRELDLFHFQENAPGAVFWHPRGWTIFQALIAFMRKWHDEARYAEVNTPDVMDRSLWEISGHWDNYRDHMFTTQTEDGRRFALKPMNCPGAVSLFNHGIKSYRDLPVRLSEFGKVHRYEPSGSLHGLLRVRHFTQDDAHIFCTLSQVESECINVLKLVLKIYQQFGFENILIKLSTRPEKRMGTEADWDRLEDALSSSLNSQQLQWSVSPGEGAFYGPKLEFVLRDAIGRDWQCGTLQVDMNLPERFDISYISEDGTPARPVLLHRALFGSLERFTGILLEHYAGKLPAWLSPVQVMVIAITDNQHDYARKVMNAFRLRGIRCETDLRNEKIGYKIREHTLNRIPYLIIIGPAEERENLVTMRERTGKSLGTFLVNEAVESIEQFCRPPEVKIE